MPLSLEDGALLKRALRELIAEYQRRLDRGPDDHATRIYQRDITHASRLLKAITQWVI